MYACSATSRSNLFDQLIFKVVPVEVWASDPSQLKKMAFGPISIKGIAEDSSFEVKDVLIVEDIVNVSGSIPPQELTNGHPH